MNRLPALPRKFLPALPEATVFSPEALAVDERPASPLPRFILRACAALFAALLVWAAIGKLDVVAIAEGKLVPASYLKIVQPAEQGIVREILVREGERVAAGQLLMRMDAKLADADLSVVRRDLALRSLQIRRIDAELSGSALSRMDDDPPRLYAEVAAQWAANRRAQEDALAQERSVLEQARQNYAAAGEVKAKLEQTLPHYRAQEEAFAKLSREGYAGTLLAQDKKRERIEKERDLQSQRHAIQSARAAIAQSERKLAQIQSEYQQKLQVERVELDSQRQKLEQELAKQEHKQALLELRATQAGFVKDLATHTPGTVVAPGTIIMTLVPADELLRAEVWVSNEDVGFVHAGQSTKVKLTAFTFQKYGMLDGRVTRVSADAAEQAPASAVAKSESQRALGAAYKTLVDLDAQHLDSDGHRYQLTPGMQVTAEIKLGERTVLEYLLSPVTKAFQEAGRER
jgi:HlyD family secretion protein